MVKLWTGVAVPENHLLVLMFLVKISILIHTLWCNHSAPRYIFQKIFSYRPIKGHAQGCSSLYYLWYCGAGGNLAVNHWGNIQGKCSEGTLWLAWAVRSNGLDVYPAIWIDFKNRLNEKKYIEWDFTYMK